jgi:hypothetical protein
MGYGCLGVAEVKMGSCPASFRFRSSRSDGCKTDEVVEISPPHQDCESTTRSSRAETTKDENTTTADDSMSPVLLGQSGSLSPQLLRRSKSASFQKASEAPTVPPPVEKPSEAPPLLIHVDVNKTIILCDSVMSKTVGYTIREIVAQVYWGRISPMTSSSSSPSADHGLAWIWQWNGKGTSEIEPPPDDDEMDEHGNWRANVVNKVDIGKPWRYVDYCRLVIKDKDAQRAAIRSFKFAGDIQDEMNRLVDEATSLMQVPEDMRGTEQLAKETGLSGEWLFIFPSFFKMVAQLQRERREFSIFFRSFGNDLDKIRQEWNAFLEGRHPLYKGFLDDVGPMDGTTPGVPDRRLGENDLHTMYRDKDGPVLALHINTNGPHDGAWDSWGKSKNLEDTRNGREYLKEIDAEVIDGHHEVQAWMLEQLLASKSVAIKDDFAWWHHNGEVSYAGKIMLHAEGMRTIFFDDNIGSHYSSDAKIVDVRGGNFSPMVFDACLDQILCKVNPVRAIMDPDYFLKLLRICDGNQARELSPMEENPEIAFQARPSVRNANSRRTSSSADSLPGLETIASREGSTEDMKSLKTASSLKPSWMPSLKSRNSRTGSIRSD